ncbi:hypothetical protein EST38_g2527 [Candolleomyces aberdarensis]|uniref:Fungal-type protein kinase domain-containing protein n=1 Tax=Candolleomyces aberdarensis TaxID=2316362 RepID=A0A4Q2DUD0_9AGAR|nr:hypothetical protein EST38_g2527 [Candolleomyces aberdarensis]
MRTRSSAKKSKDESFNRAVDEKQQLVTPELGDVVELLDHSFARSLYHDIASDSAIDSFLKKSRSYSLTHRRWKLPRNCAKLFDSDFYTPFFNVVSSIVKHFWSDATTQGTRLVVDSHTTDLQHCEADSQSHYSRPSLVIKAEGPSFRLPRIIAGADSLEIGFSNISSCIEIQLEGEESPVSEQLVHVAIYARQLFIHQPNRQFVRVLVLTGQYLRLFHFDSSGVQYTPLLNIHTNPHTFVRLVLGLSSPNESDIGLDTSIQWRVENGRKVSGTLKTRGADDTEVVYPLRNVEPLFRRSNICGRRTTCWSISDPFSGEEFIVKDSWRSHDRTSECVYLREALGISGVAQMLSCESDRGQTAHLRGVRSAACSSDFENRINTRVVIKCYGDSIIKFTSATELLCALRDAIAGHMGLLKRGTLHRDVSIRNILTGRPGAEPGDRGILIDLDMAIHDTTDGISPLTDWRVGTTLYQSVMVLSSCGMPGPLAHDHLDDLESFLYVLTHIIHLYDPLGIFHSVVDPLRLWDGQEGQDAAGLKLGFLAVDSIPYSIASRWPEACVRVLNGFRAFLRSIVREKIRIIHKKPANATVVLKSLRSSAEDHYAHVLQLFDDGIAALEKGTAEDTAARCVTPASLAPVIPSMRPSTERSPLKRASDDYPDNQPAAKRTNSPCSPTSRSNFRSA